MEELRVETRTYRVGGDLVWNDWEWSVDHVFDWLATNMTLVLVVLAVVIVGLGIWRLAKGGTPRY